MFGGMRKNMYLCTLLISTQFIHKQYFKENEKRYSSRKLSPRRIQGYVQRRYVPYKIYMKDNRDSRI